jgi:voltage-dependent calcium channel L type alpha-1D
MIVVSFLVLNLFVAVIMDNFEYLTQEESHLSENDLPRFIELWSRFDPKGTGYIGHTDLVQLLREEPPPLGFGKKCPEDRVFVKMLRLSIPLRPDGTVQFNAALLAILRVNLDIYSTSSGLPMSERNVELRQKLRSNFEIEDDMLDTLLPPVTYTGMTTGEHYAARLMQRLYRQVRRRRRQAQQQAAIERVPLEAGLREEQRRPGLVLRRTLSSDDLHAASAVSRPTRMQLPPTPVDQLSLFSASRHSQRGGDSGSGEGSGGASFA